MSTRDIQAASSPIIAQDILRRYHEELLYEALNVMGQLKADAPVSADWIAEGERLRNQAQALFASVET